MGNLCRWVKEGILQGGRNEEFLFTKANIKRKTFYIKSMDKLTFQHLNSICELNIEKKHVSKCLQLLQHEDCIFDSGIIMPQDHIASLYEFRFNNAKESGRLESEFLLDYKNCVDQLNLSTSDFLGITSVYGENIVFMIFYEPHNKMILGVLMSKTSESIESIEEHASEIVGKGLSSGNEKYSKGIFVRDWK